MKLYSLFNIKIKSPLFEVYLFDLFLSMRALGLIIVLPNLNLNKLSIFLKEINLFYRTS